MNVQKILCTLLTSYKATPVNLSGTIHTHKLLKNEDLKCVLQDSWSDMGSCEWLCKILILKILILGWLNGYGWHKMNSRLPIHFDKKDGASLSHSDQKIGITVTLFSKHRIKHQYSLIKIIVLTILLKAKLMWKLCSKILNHTFHTPN